MADNACFFHGGELGLGNGEFIRVKATGLGKHRRYGVITQLTRDLHLQNLEIRGYTMKPKAEIVNFTFSEI